MFGSIYTSTGAMLGFSSGLDLISNNISNMNTVGFKRTDANFADAFYRGQLNSQGFGGWQPLQLGSGNNIGASVRVFAQGDLSATDRDLDVAISGNGFFVLRKDGETFYSRAGQFEFDDDGFLVNPSTGGRVAALSGTMLEDISIAGLRTNPPAATAKISFEDNLSTGDTEHEVQVSVYDALGGSHQLTIEFTNNNAVAPRSWVVRVLEDATELSTGEVRFRADGSPETGFNSVSVDLTGPAIPTSTITLDFGEPGSFTAATSFSGGTTSTLRMASSDGHAVGSLVETTFDREGWLKLTYSNGQTVEGPRLALADFANRQALEPQGDNLFIAPQNANVRLAHATVDGMGELAGKNLELSNVDLTSEFSEIIINQRGFQASSQLLGVANELLEQLLTGGSR